MLLGAGSRRCLQRTDRRRCGMAWAERASASLPPRLPGGRPPRDVTPRPGPAPRFHQPVELAALEL